MFGEVVLPFESFFALVALEWSFHSMCLRVALQMNRLSASVIALVTFEWFLSCVHPHHVNFQTTRFNARIIARCAPLWFFTRVSLVVLNQVTRCYGFIFTLIASESFFPGVLLDMRFEVGSLFA